MEKGCGEIKANCVSYPRICVCSLCFYEVLKQAYTHAWMQACKKQRPQRLIFNLFAYAYDKRETKTSHKNGKTATCLQSVFSFITLRGEAKEALQLPFS